MRGDLVNIFDEKSEHEMHDDSLVKNETEDEVIVVPVPKAERTDGSYFESL